MLNKDLNLEECLSVLSCMIDDMTEFDCAGDEAIYILVPPTKRQMILLRTLIPEQENIEQYLQDYGGQDYREDGIDITGLWSMVSERFCRDIFVDFKQRLFYTKNEKYIQLESEYNELQKEHKEFRDKIIKVIARNLTAWDTSKDKTEGLLPEVYLTNKRIYKELTGKEYFFNDAVELF